MQRILIKNKRKRGRKKKSRKKDMQEKQNKDVWIFKKNWWCLFYSIFPANFIVRFFISLLSRVRFVRFKVISNNIESNLVNYLDEDLSKLEMNIFAGELLVDGAIGLDLMLDGGLLGFVEMDLDESRAV